MPDTMVRVDHLLCNAARAELSLMQQYLFAAYAVKVPKEGPLHDEAVLVRRYLLQIAREEMGHFMTVQNMRLLFSLPLAFGDPKGSMFPVRYRLEPLSIEALSKYIAAESPTDPAGYLRSQDKAALIKRTKELVAGAPAANRGPVGNVGELYAELETLIRTSIPDAALIHPSAARQASWEDWGYSEAYSKPLPARTVHVDRFEGFDLAGLREQLVSAIHKIADQGEGSGQVSDGHFDRLLVLLDIVHNFSNKRVDLNWPVVANPSTDDIANPRTQAWSALCDIRYRMLLSCLMHFLCMTTARYEPSGPEQGSRTPRGLLLLWAFDEMRRLAKIAKHLVRMPVDEPGGLTAGPTFDAGGIRFDEDTIDWKDHQTHLDAARPVLDRLLAGPEDHDDPFLSAVRTSDALRAQQVDTILHRPQQLSRLLPAGFQKVAHILEESVRGFTIGAHDNFWTNLNRDQFLNITPFGANIVGRNHRDPMGALDVSQATLVRTLRAMPLQRPKIPPVRRRVVEDWIKDNAPDDTGCIGVAHEPDPKES